MFICIAPVIFFLLIVSLLPVIIALVASFRNMSLTEVFDHGKFLGLDNYRTALSSKSGFYNSLWLTFILSRRAFVHWMSMCITPRAK